MGSAPLKPGDRVQFTDSDGILHEGRVSDWGSSTPGAVTVSFGANFGERGEDGRCIFAPGTFFSPDKLTLVARAQYASPGKRLVEIDDADVATFVKLCEKWTHSFAFDGDDATDRSDLQRVGAFLARAKAGDA